MAANTVKREGTGGIITFDTVAEVGGAADFISSVEKVWGEGVLLKPSSTSVFTARTPEPFPRGIYAFHPTSGTAVNITQLGIPCFRCSCSLSLEAKFSCVFI